jgi:hypothetical protein
VGAADNPQPRFGPIPAGFTGTTPAEFETLPDYIAVAGADVETVVGYVARENLFPSPEELRTRGPKNPDEARRANYGWREAYPVYDTHLNVVGFMVNDEGFVPAGQAARILSDSTLHVLSR